MEAKLASMKKRKPEDEDYVPGQTISGVASGSNSPAPAAQQGDDKSADLEDEALIGEEEAGRAAEELEQELMAELEAGNGLSGSAGASPMPLEDDKPPKRQRVDPPDQTTLPLHSSLPPRPPASIPTDTDPPKSSSMAPPPSSFQRGLAGLPKKPTF